VAKNSPRFSDSIMYETYHPATFWLAFNNYTVELRGGYGLSEDDVLITWTAPRPLQWVHRLAVGVQFDADEHQHIFSLYRSVGWLPF